MIGKQSQQSSHWILRFMTSKYLFPTDPMSVSTFELRQLRQLRQLPLDWSYLWILWYLWLGWTKPWLPTSGLGRQILHPPLRQNWYSTLMVEFRHFEAFEVRIGWCWILGFGNALLEVWKSWARRSVLCRPSLFSSIWRQTLGWNVGVGQQEGPKEPEISVMSSTFYLSHCLKSEQDLFLILTLGYHGLQYL